MKPGLRKLALTAHVTASVGWLGAVAGSIALAVAGLASRDPQVVRAAYLALDLTGRWVLVPLSLASLVTGLIQALGSPWGLVRHYWVVAKLVINLFASTILLLYTHTLGQLGTRVADPGLSGDGILALRNPSPVVHAAGGLALLLVAVALSVYKPRGVIARR
jgi:hypothetical protein